MENLNNSSYNFVILGTKDDIFKTSFQAVTQYDNVVYLSGEVNKGRLCKIVHRFHFSLRVNSFFSLPFKQIWNASKLSFSFKENRPLCFIIFTAWMQLEHETKIISFLKKKYPGCKIVWFAQDLLSNVLKAYSDEHIDVSDLKSKVDLAISYDMGDASKYGFEYHPTVLSKISIPLNKAYESDVFFIGKSKKRLDLLINLSKGLKEYGVKCNFMVLGIPKEHRRDSEYINYIDKSLTYRENLNYAVNSKCLLELMQPGAVGYTFRTSEALLYGKKMITNNLSIENAPFYKSENICLLKNLSKDFYAQTAKMIFDEKDVFYERTDLISPNHLLMFIEEKLPLTCN